MEPQSNNPQDVVSLFPLVLTCLTQVSEQLIRAGIEVFMQSHGGSATYTQQVVVLWRWRIPALGAESQIGYASMSDALLDALIYFIRNGADPEELLLPQ